MHLVVCSIPYYHGPLSRVQATNRLVSSNHGAGSCLLRLAEPRYLFSLYSTFIMRWLLTFWRVPAFYSQRVEQESASTGSSIPIAYGSFHSYFVAPSHRFIF
jgi:hypothetical protein